jgi:hypothetical protein
MMQKILRYIDRLGLDKDELLEMTFIEALLKMEDAKDMWKYLKVGE